MLAYTLCLLTLSQASVLPIKYSTNQDANGFQPIMNNVDENTQFRFIRKNSTLNNVNDTNNTTFRLWGRTYNGDGLKIDSSSDQTEEWSPSVVTSTNKLTSEDFTDEDYSQEYSSEEPSEYFENSVDVLNASRYGEAITLDDITTTSNLIVHSRGVANAFWDTVNILYQCVREYWHKGVVQCLTMKTASMINGVDDNGRHPRWFLDAIDGVEEKKDGSMLEDQSEGRKKMYKKMLLPLTLLVKMKFFLILMGVAFVAGKAILLSLASFMMGVMLHMKKSSGDSGHSTEQISVYPSHHYNKRLDDLQMSMTGGRGFFM